MRRKSQCWPTVLPLVLRPSTGGMEEVLISHPDVAECAVIGAADPLKGQLPLGFLVPNDGVERDPATLDEIATTLHELGYPKDSPSPA